MGGILGTLLMLLECSGVGASIDLDRIPKPAVTPIERWLTSFPSYGYLLAVDPERVAEVERRFAERGIASGAIGTCEAEGTLHVARGDERELFWDLRSTPFTGARAYARA